MLENGKKIFFFFFSSFLMNRKCVLDEQKRYVLIPIFLLGSSLLVINLEILDVGLKSIVPTYFLVLKFKEF